MPSINALVWDENPKHAPKELYPDNIRGAIAAGLRELGGDQVEVSVGHIDDADQGVPEEALAKADVLLWWGHLRHKEVSDELAERIKRHVHERGMGLIVLHSGHYSKIFKTVLGATGHLKGGWRESWPKQEMEEITVCAPRHPIAAGISDFTLENEEMYGAPFGAPPPNVVVFQSYFPNGGEYFPSFALTVGEGIDPDFESGEGLGANQGEGAGRFFYFRPGHEAFGTYFHPTVKQILWNAVKWAAHRD